MLRPQNAAKSLDCLDKQRSLSSAATFLLVGVFFFPSSFFANSLKKSLQRQKDWRISVQLWFLLLCNHFWGHIVTRRNEMSQNLPTRVYCIDSYIYRRSFSSPRHGLKSLFPMFLCSIYDSTHSLSLRVCPFTCCRDSEVTNLSEFCTQQNPGSFLETWKCSKSFL